MAKKIKRIPRYGLVKIRGNQKTAWISAENKNGWSLGLALSDRTIWLRNTRFSSKKALVAAVSPTKIVFMPLKKV